MKIFIIIPFLLVLIGKSYSQQMHSTLPLTKEDYLKKRENQNTAGKAMLIGGILLFIIGSAVVTLDWSAEDINYIPPAVGLGIAVGSIPFFISAGHYKRKAASISLGNQPLSFTQPKLFILNSQPTLTLKIGLN